MAYFGQRKLANFRQPRMEARTYLDSFAEKACDACGAMDGTIVPAHIRLLHFGKGVKPDDWQAIPLCMRCHDEFDGRGKREGQSWEWLLRNILFPILQRRYARWKAGR